MPFALLGVDLRPILDLRERFERRFDPDFSNRTNDSVSDLFGRYRAGLAFQDRSIGGQIVYQYGHDEDWNAKQNRAPWRSDLLVGYAQAAIGEDRLTVGRQRLTFGGERLLGLREWNNVSIAWDGGRFSGHGLDLFAFKSGLLPTPDETVSIYGGAYATRAGQTLAFYDRDGRGRVERVTASHSYRGALKSVGLDAEVAGQAGSAAEKHVLAGAAEAIASVPVARRLSFSVQGSIASGGGHGETSNTFVPPYPSTHDHYGITDLVRWENLRALGTWLQYQPDRRSRVKLEFHDLNLDSAHDAWYNGSSGLPEKRPGGTFDDPMGSHGRHLGDDVDLDLSRALNVHQTVQAGIGVFHPGGYVRAFNGASTSNQVWGYVQWTYRL